MSDSSLAITFLVIVMILYVTEPIPIVLTTLMGMLAMAFSGILTYHHAFSGFGNSVIMMMIGMSIFGSAFFTTGLASRVSDVLLKISGDGERRFLCYSCIMAVVLGIFFNAVIVITIFMAVVDSVTANAQGRFSRKQVILPICAAAVYGGTLTNVSLTSLITASGFLEESGYGRGFHLLEPAMLGLPAVLVILTIILTVGYDAGKKWFDFHDTMTEIAVTRRTISPYNGPKVMILLAVMAGCIVCFVATKIDMGAIALSAAIILILTGCISVQEAFGGVQWITVVVVGASIGFANGVSASGAGLRIADFILEVCGGVGNTPFGMCVVVFLLSTLLSNFISNNSTVMIILPIALLIAQELGADPLYYALACGVGSNLSIATPISTAAITLTTSAGYRTKDYIRFGGLINLCSVLAGIVALRLLVK